MQFQNIGCICLLSIADSILACTIDEDCSLNGICTSSKWNSLLPSFLLWSTCQCDPGWIGIDCGILDLRPAHRGTGYNHTQFDEENPTYYYGPFGNSSWGGQIIHDPNDHSLFHLFADQFDHGCGLSNWRPNSILIRAESRTGPQGPFYFAERITGTFRHNSRVTWSEIDQKWLLWTIGTDYSPTSNSCCESISRKDMPNKISVSASHTLINGTWTPFKIILDSIDPQSTNPSPIPLWTPQNRTQRIAMAVEDNAIFIAETWHDPFKHVKTQDASWNTSEYSPTWTEDPFVWRDKRGNFHILCHYMIDLSEHHRRTWPRVGTHLFSRTLEGQWHFPQQVAYTSTVEFDDDTVFTFKRRERPWLFFSEDGEMTPLFLVTGVQEFWEKGISYTLVQPIGGGWKEFGERVR